MKLKKIPYYLMVALLTVGASLILGLLSFTGMLGLYPILGLAIATFGLSVAYEGQIYLQNIIGAFKKLFKTDYLEQTLAKRYLLEHFPSDEELDISPPIFKEIKAQMERVDKYNHKQLDKDSLARKKREEKILSGMIKLIAAELFHSQSQKTQLGTWLDKHEKDEWVKKLNRHRWISHAVKAFSAIAAAFGGIGTIYLLVEAFGALSFMAAVPAIWPAIIIPLAIVAGVAYGMLVYNAVMDFINNETIKEWYNKFVSDWKNRGFLHNALMAFMTVTLVLLALTLTVFTAGTWWTVADKALPVFFEGMKKVPTIVIGIITGLASLLFILPNTSDTLKLVRDFFISTQEKLQKIYEEGFIKQLWEPLVEKIKGWAKNENLAQKLNPFRILIKLTVTPLRIILFLGHLISIAFTADRMPGVPQIASLLIALISEGFEDAHYFIEHEHEEGDENEHEHEHGHGHDHVHGGYDKSKEGVLNPHHHKHTTKELLEEHLDAGHGHSHESDIPTVLIKFLASPLYLLAALWDYGFSQLNEEDKKISFSYAFDKQRGCLEETVNITEASPLSFKSHQTLISQKLTKLINRHEDARQQELITIKQAVDNCKGIGALSETLKQAKDNAILNNPRFFSVDGSKTKTCETLEALWERVRTNEI